MPDVPALFFREFSFVGVSGSNADGLLRRENPSYYLIFRNLACSSATSLIFFFFLYFRQQPGCVCLSEERSAFYFFLVSLSRGDGLGDSVGFSQNIINYKMD